MSNVFIKDFLAKKEASMNRKERRAKERETGNKIVGTNRPYVVPRCPSCKTKLELGKIAIGETVDVKCSGCNKTIKVNGV